MSNPLQKLATCGQSFWLDNLSRTLITSGELERLIRDDGLRGITSNPTIFEKALAESDEYDLEIERHSMTGKTPEEIFEAIAIHDIRRAADLLRPVYKATNGEDGFVSLELPPALSLDTKRSFSEARRLFTAIGRQNVMIKVPGTAEGIPAVEDLIAEGVNVNITLLFSIQDYERVAEAYIRGLERRVEAGKPIDSIASVASFFVSRVDTEIDRRLDELIAKTDDEERKNRLKKMKGTVAIANAKVAYDRFTKIFLESERFAKLRDEHGAKYQRPLWASTSTKNPEYRDVLYIESLIGPHTVETMPPASVDAFRDHGKVAVTVTEGIDEAYQTLEELAEIGISYDEVIKLLQDQGVDAFTKSFDNLLEGIDNKRAELAKTARQQQCHLGEQQAEVHSVVRRHVNNRTLERIWERDASLWSNDSAVQAKIADRLGWLDAPAAMLERVEEFEQLGNDIREAGFTNAVLLGMGGSSLAPEVLHETFGNVDGYPELTVLDTTNPDTITRITNSIDLNRTIFIVSSKSGTTVETSTLLEYFFSLVKEQKGDEAGQHFIAITDPDTVLQKQAGERNFRYVFVNAPDIGGRYSALSYFGLVPAAVIGMNVRALIERALDIAEQTKTSDENNPILWLGVALGTLADISRDKVTFIPDPAVASLSDWLEQLIAESTGKEGAGIVPIAHEPPGAPSSYDSDRVFVGFDLVPQPHLQTEAVLIGLETAGHPVIRIRLRDEWDVAAEFFRWEFATAIAGAVLHINPFDEPNVQESKDNTNRLLDQYRKEGEISQPPVAFESETVAAANTQGATLQEALGQFLAQVHIGDYVAIMAFADRTPETQIRLDEIRRLIRDRLKVATTLGYGPRFLHSTGQLCKGGPQNGTFLQIVIEPSSDVPIPGEDFSFSTLFRAQGIGDYEALRSRGRPLLRLTVREDPVVGLDQILGALVTAALR